MSYYGQGPQRIPRSGEDRLLERLRSLEQRLAGVERRGSSATWSSAGVAGHAPTHSISGSDPLGPSDIGAASQDDLTDLSSAVASLPTGHAETITGDAVETVFEITHGQGTRDCLVMIRENASPWALMQTGFGIEYTTANSITITWDAAPSAGAEYRVLIAAL